MAPILIIADSFHGQTERIAEAIAGTLRARGHDVHVTEPAHAVSLDLARFAAIVLGGAIHVGGVSKRLLDFVRHHHEVLSVVPTSLFTVSLAAARRDERSRAEVNEHRERFTEETGFAPRRFAAFGGALHYTKYDPLTRFLARLMAHAQGDPTDVTRDHELTDWSAVSAFAAELADELERVTLAAE